MKSRKHGRAKTNSKQTMAVGGYRLSAWIDSHGMMRLEVSSKNGDDVIGHLNSKWEGGFKPVRIKFTDNENIIHYVTGDVEESDDQRPSPIALRQADIDPVFAAWYTGEHGRTPAESANLIEATRRRERRRIEDGALIGRGKR